jgi:hypothetical protein
MTDSPLGALNGGQQKHPTHTKAWSWLATATTLSFGVSLATGLYLFLFAAWNWNAGQIVLVVHLVAGIAAVALFVGWMIEHLMKGIKRTQNRLFLWTSWCFFVLYCALLASGLAIALPFFLFLIGIVWFYRFEITDLVATAHLYTALITALALTMHLALPHWNTRAKRR